MKKAGQGKSQGESGHSPVLIQSFSIDHAERVTGLSKSRLARWDRMGFFAPEYADAEDRGNPYSRVYSFSDLVGLRTLSILIDKHQISIDELRSTYPELAKRVKRPWSETQLSVLNGKVVFDLDTQPQDRHGQIAGNHIALPTVASEVAARTEELRQRKRDQIGVIERNKFIAHNAKVLAGTRIPVSAVESFITAGYSDDAIVAEYPSLTTIDIATVRRNMKVAA